MSKILATGAMVLLASGITAAYASDFQGSDELGKAKKKHTVAAPEIDAASAGSALILLAGGLVVLFGRKNARE